MTLKLSYLSYLRPFIYYKHYKKMGKIKINQVTFKLPKLPRWVRWVSYSKIKISCYSTYSYRVSKMGKIISTFLFLKKIRKREFLKKIKWMSFCILLVLFIKCKTIQYIDEHDQYVREIENINEEIEDSKIEGFDYDVFNKNDLYDYD